MKLVAGLGNPGQKYKNNRHNSGFIVLDELVKSLNSDWSYNKKILSDILQAKENGFILLKPQTFMNNSGEAISKALEFYNLQTSDLVVVHDDVDLEPLQFRLSTNSSSAGHHGVEDIIDKLGTHDFKRLRIGIGRPVENTGNVEKYVLEDFSAVDLERLKRSGIEHLLSSLKV